jgi:glycosyltransferase involved in cell wall biosynthesis
VVSVVIPCYNPGPHLLDAIASARSQTAKPVEIIVVNDGASNPESRAVLKQAAPLTDIYIEQENHGVAAARNVGFSAAKHRYVLPLDCDDAIRPEYIARCVAVLEERPEAAFAHTDYELFGVKSYPERCSYNLYRLLEQNTLTYSALIRKEDWEQIGGYDETMRLGYEDWEFWLRLGASRRFGAHVPARLFRYRKHGRSLSDTASEHHEELVAYIRTKLAALYTHESVTRIKAEWLPSVCLAGNCDLRRQTIGDLQALPAGDLNAIAGRSRAPAILAVGNGPLDAHSAELAALCVWGGNPGARFSDGSVALARDGTTRRARAGEPSTSPYGSGFGGTIRRHWINAELNRAETWRQPLLALSRLIPLRVKEAVNSAAGRPVFDLSFYLRFQPRAILTGKSVVEPLRYLPKEAAKPRVALVTPHLGAGGAELVLLEIAAALSRSGHEVLLIATQSTDGRWAARWRQAADHVYDLSPLVVPERMSAAVYSIVANWKCSGVVLQNSLFGYAAAPLIRNALPGVRLVDIVHAAGDDWDFLRSTAEVSRSMDARVAISAHVAERLRQDGVPPERIRLIRNGVDLERFRPREPSTGRPAILFLGRLDAVKRPMMLAEIADELATLRGRDFRILVAGDGPELRPLQAKVAHRRLADLFEFAGFAGDTPALFAKAAILVLPSRSEGVPLSILEAMASGIPVVASNVGAVAEAIDASCGVLIDSGDDETRRFAAAIDQLLNDGHLRSRLGSAGRRKVEAYYDIAEARAAYARLLD